MLQIANPCISCIARTAQWPLRRKLNANGKRQLCRSLVGQKFWSTHFVIFIVEHHVTEVGHCVTNVIFAFPHKREMSGVSFSEWYGFQTTGLHNADEHNNAVNRMPMNEPNAENPSTTAALVRHGIDVDRVRRMYPHALRYDPNRDFVARNGSFC